MSNYINNRNRHYYNRNIRPCNNTKNPLPMDIPHNINNSDIPPEPIETPCTDTFSNNNNFNNNPNNTVNNLLGMFNPKSFSLDKDKLILLGLMYLLYKEDKSKDNFKILIALGYILI